jgi:hypothetical protein
MFIKLTEVKISYVGQGRVSTHAKSSVWIPPHSILEMKTHLNEAIESIPGTGDHGVTLIETARGQITVMESPEQIIELSKNATAQ